MLCMLMAAHIVNILQKTQIATYCGYMAIFQANLSASKRSKWWLSAKMTADSSMPTSSLSREAVTLVILS